MPQPQNTTYPAHDNGHVGAPVDIDLRLVVNDRWCAFDLDELLEAVEFAGLPNTLIVTYCDQGGRRRYVERRSRRNGRAVTS